MNDKDFCALCREMASDNLRQGHHAQALEQLDVALSVAPDEGETHLLRGICLQRMGRLEQARVAMQAALAAGLPEAQHLAAAYQNRIAANARWVKEIGTPPFTRADSIDWLIDFMNRLIG
jgi:tetratricopeptide (TPR) repeat protein